MNTKDYKKNILSHINYLPFKISQFQVIEINKMNGNNWKKKEDKWKSKDKN